jgi:hypothetical protein
MGLWNIIWRNGATSESNGSYHPNAGHQFCPCDMPKTEGEGEYLVES